MKVLLVADDLTGAVDTGDGFARRGHDTVVAVGTPTDPTDPAEAGDPTVLAVNTDSRYADEETARDAVARAIRGRNAPVVYKKVDSTLRGNVASEVEAALETTGADRAIVAPAFPATGRTTRNGVHRVHGRRLSETAYAGDANPPATDRLPALFEGSTYPVDHLPLETVAEGADAIRRALERAENEEPRIATFDATEEAHLAAIARAAEELPERVVYVGSGGLAAHVAVPEGGSGGEFPAVESPDARGVLAIVGSVADATLVGLEAVPDSAVIELDPRELIADPEDAGRAAGERAADRLARGERALVTAARSRRDVEATREAGAAAGHDAAATADRVRRALAAAAGTGLEERPAGLFLTGGDVALAVCEEAGIGTIRLSGEAVAEGVPRGRVAGGPLAGTSLVTKAGGFGGESTIVTVLESLEGGD